MKKTLQECKEIVAKEQGYKSWPACYADSPLRLDLIIDLANKMYYEQSNWISVDDSLPEFDVNVLVIGEQKGMNPQMGGGDIFISIRNDLRKTALFKDREKYQCDNNFKMMNYVTHWQPLPKKL